MMKKALVLGCCALGLSLSLGLASQAFSLKVKVKIANARSEPDRSAAVVMTFPQGTILKSNLKMGEWYEILVEDDEGNQTSAYINSDVVDVVGGGAESAPVPEQPAADRGAKPPTEFAEPEPARPETIPTFRAGPSKWEFSTAASYVVSRLSYEGETNTITTISVPLRLGYHLTKRLEIEPELILARLTQEDASATNVSAMANILFNFSLSPRLSAFVLGGAGAVLSSASIEDISESRTNFGFNGGAGLRWHVSNRGALRMEYRLVSYSDKPEDLDSKVTYMDHKVFIGISLFF